MSTPKLIKVSDISVTVGEVSRTGTQCIRFNIFILTKLIYTFEITQVLHFFAWIICKLLFIICISVYMSKRSFYSIFLFYSIFTCKPKYSLKETFESDENGKCKVYFILKGWKFFGISCKNVALFPARRPGEFFTISPGHKQWHMCYDV